MLRVAVLALSISMTTTGVGIVPVSSAPTDVQLPSITGSARVDQRIRALAEERGYQPRAVAVVAMVGVDGHLLTPEAAAAWQRLKSAAGAEGHRLRLIAGFRDHATQRRLFLSRLGGESDTSIDRCLRWSAPPGYSKHHTGRALDLTVAGVRAGLFATTSAYEWMIADDYRNARRFGFVPSYPAGESDYGPEPEPWEWVYVGFGAPRQGGTHPI